MDMTPSMGEVWLIVTLTPGNFVSRGDYPVESNY